MEFWFILAVLSAVTAGFESFVHKVAAERRYDIILLNFFATLVSVIVFTVCMLMLSDFSRLWEYPTLIVVVGAVLYLFTLIFKVASLREIDTAIFYPIYKVLGPLITIVAGVIFFGERFTVLEWVGLGLSPVSYTHLTLPTIYSV